MKTFFCFPQVEIAGKKNFEDLFCLKKKFEYLFLDRLKNFFENLLFWSSLVLVSLVLGLSLERVCPWPWPRNFFVSLASSLVSSTPPLIGTIRNLAFRTFAASEKDDLTKVLAEYRTLHRIAYFARNFAKSSFLDVMKL